MDLKAARKLTIGNALNEKSYNTSVIRLTYGGYGETGIGRTGQLYAGGSQAEVTVNGSVAVTGTSDQDELAWFNGKNLVFNAFRKPALTDTSSDMYNAVALDFTDSQFWSGNVDTTETTKVNGHILTNGSNAFVLYGSQAVTLNGLKGDFENNGNAFSLTDRGGSSIQIGDGDTAQTTVNGEIVTGKDTVLYVGGKNVLLDNADHTALYANAVSKNITIGKTSADSVVAENTVIKGRILVNQPETFQVLGKRITLMNGAAPDDGTLSTTVKTKEDGTSTDPDSHTHDAVVIQQAADNALVIGEADSNVSIDGRLVGLNGGYSVDGDIFHIIKSNPLIMVAVSPMTGQLIIPYFISHIFIFKGELAITLYFATLDTSPDTFFSLNAAMKFAHTAEQIILTITPNMIIYAIQSHDAANGMSIITLVISRPFLESFDIPVRVVTIGDGIALAPFMSIQNNLMEE